MSSSVRVSLSIGRDPLNGAAVVDVVWNLDSGAVLEGQWPLDGLDSPLGMGPVATLQGNTKSNRQLLTSIGELTPAEFQYAQEMTSYLIAPHREMRNLLKANESETTRLAVWSRSRQLDELPWEIVPVGPDLHTPLCVAGGSVTRVVQGVSDERPWTQAPRVLIGGASPDDIRLPHLVGAEEFVEATAATVARLSFGGERIVPDCRWPLSPDLFGSPIDVDIAILVGHGVSQQNGGGMVFESNRHRATVSIGGLALALQPSRLAVLMSCHGASGTEADATLAEALVSAGVPAVVAFGGLIDWADAQSMVTRLLAALCEGCDLEDAVAQARLAVKAEDRRSWTQLRLVQRGDARVAMWALHRPNMPLVPEQILNRVTDEGRSQLAPRPSVTAAVREHLRDADNNRVVIVTGDPGDGKTSFLASLLANGRAPIDETLGSGAVVHAHWCVRNDESTRQGRRLVDDWSETLSTAIPGFAAALKQADSNTQETTFARCQRLVLEPLAAARRGGFEAPVVLVVDALDEAAADRSEDPVVRLLQSVMMHLPPNTQFLCTTRVDSPIKGTLIISLRDAEHAMAVNDWLRARIGAALEGVVSPARIEQASDDAVVRCRQNFLVARSLVRAVLDEVDAASSEGIEPSLDAAAWPATLAEAFQKDLDRLSEDREARRLVNLVAVAQDGGIPNTILRDVLYPNVPYADDDLTATIGRGRYYLTRGRRKDTHTWQLFHDAFASHVRELPHDEHLSDHENPLREGPLAHKAVAALADRQGFSWLDAERYLIVAVPTHLAAAARGLGSPDRVRLVQKLASICFDIEWIERRVVHSGPGELLSDLIQAKEVGVTEPPPRPTQSTR